MNLKCPKCGGQIQATQKTYLTIDADGEVSDSMLPPDYDVYCENDCDAMALHVPDSSESELISAIEEHIEGQTKEGKE